MPMPQMHDGLGYLNPQVQCSNEAQPSASEGGMTRPEPRDFFYYTAREEAEAQQQTRLEDDADAIRKGEQ